MKGMENTGTETQTLQQQTDGQQTEKMFTQDDVNRIVGERLARVKTDVSPQFQERERAISQRELQIDAREMLVDAGLPKELLEAIDCSTKEKLENSIETIKRLFGSSGSGNQVQGKPAPAYRIISTSVSNSSNGSGNRNRADDPEEIRKAMGLKG